jgi:hypothetical protein
MDQNCKSCNEIVTGNFCINCGQKKYKRIDKKYITDEIQYTFLHTNKGLLYSVKNIIKNPGKTAREFVEGNRINHYKPILLTFLLAGFSAFISLKILKMKEVIKDIDVGVPQNPKFMEGWMDIVTNYLPILMVLVIPFFALTTKIAFRRWGHNYYEHVVMNAYILSFYTLFSIIVVSPLMFIFKGNTSENILNVSIISYILVIPMLIWFFKGFYPDKKLKTIILKVFAVIGLVILAYVILVLIAAIIAIVVGMILGPEVLKQFKPQ